MYEFLVIKGKEIHDIIRSDYKNIINIVGNAYIAHYRGNTVNPNTYSLKFPQKPNSRINALPAYVGQDINLAGIKWISSFPDNINQNIPRASAIVVLNDVTTGYPIACLEGSIISAARTAASTVLGAYVLNNGERHVNKITFVGCGVITKYIFDFFNGSGWSFDQINLYDLDIAYAKTLLRYIQEKTTTKVVIHDMFTDSCIESDFIVLATTVSEPYIFDKDIFRNNPLILNISLRDISPEIINTSVNVVDDVHHCLNASTSTHLAYLKYGNHDFIYATIGELLAGKELLNNSKQQLTVYSPFGMGILDIAVGSFIYEAIKQSKSGTLIKDFFYEQKRW